MKNKPAVLKAIGLYPTRASSIVASVILAASCFFSMSAVRADAADKISIAEASPRISLLVYNTVKILVSVSASLALFFAPSRTNCSFWVSRSGFSLATTIPKS